jgi:uncharacterized membrane protein
MTRWAMRFGFVHLVIVIFWTLLNLSRAAGQ